MEVFSDLEQKIIRAIGNKNISIEEICIKVFRNDRDAPFDKKITVSNSIRRIIQKCIWYNVGWTLVKEKVDGVLHIKRGGV